MEIYLKLFEAALVPVALAVLFYILQKFKFVSKIPYWGQQIILGVVFGFAAIIGTEHGVDIGGATANARDAAPLCAGLIFGGPAGVIAGIIGGVERWFAVAWGAGEYSRFACSVSTALSGIYAALLRKHMLDNRRPTPAFGFVTAVVMEVLHLSILFLTHISDPEKAYQIVKITTLPMILCNAVSVCLALFFVLLLSSGINRGKKVKRSIAQKIQSWMLVCVVLAYLGTTAFVYALQTNSALVSAKNLMKSDCEDIIASSAGDSTVISNRVLSNKVGDTGYMILVDNGGNIIASGKEMKARNISDFGIDFKNNSERGKLTKIDGEKSIWMSFENNGKYIITVIPQAEAYATRDASTYINSFMEVLVFALFFAVIYFLIKKLVVNNIRTVNDKLEQIIGGNLEVKVDVHSSEEFASLSDDINSTVDTLKHYIDEAAARIDRELEFAKAIQHSALPSVFPAFPNIPEIDLYATMHTAKEVGGDFYDFYALPDGKVAFLVADVSGKGIPAAMFMMRAKTTIKTLAESGLPVDEIFTKSNEKLCDGNDAGMFVTAWMGILDVKTGHITFANAGHNPPLIYRNGGKYEYLHSRAGLVLAGMEGVNYKLQELDLMPGDKIYLYTDGVTEANDKDGNLYGEDRLSNLLNGICDCNPKDTLDAVKTDIDRFAADVEQFDDITMLCININNK